VISEEEGDDQLMSSSFMSVLFLFHFFLKSLRNSCFEVEKFKDGKKCGKFIAESKQIIPFLDYRSFRIKSKPLPQVIKTE